MRTHVDSSTIIDLYMRQHMTMRAVAATLGISHSTVRNRLMLAGIEYHQSDIPCTCAHCGAACTKDRKRLLRNSHVYCSRTCYHAAVTMGHTNTNGESRRGGRRARIIMHALTGQVVHHIDGNTLNNDPANLMLFESQSDHLSYHKSGKARELAAR